MKLVTAIVHNDDAGPIVDALLQQQYRATRVNSSGGFLRKSNATLLIGVDESAVDEVIEIIRSRAKARSQVPADGASDPARRNADLKAAVVFVVDVEGFARV